MKSVASTVPSTTSSGTQCHYRMAGKLVEKLMTVLSNSAKCLSPTKSLTLMPYLTMLGTRSAEVDRKKTLLYYKGDVLITRCQRSHVVAPTSLQVTTQHQTSINQNSSNRCSSRSKAECHERDASISYNTGFITEV